jgi:transcriptional regulator with PAS, ATPase and Fis domain
MLRELDVVRPAVVCENARMRKVLELARRAGESDAKVLINGESGVGKDLVAREIHYASKRQHGPFVAVNCAGVPETLLESELFGHLRGSFTGAYRDRPGKLQLADHGTLFLDEVGEMSLRMQALLLRFLENGEIQTIGGSLAKTVNVRIVAVTNRDLPQRVAAGEFREDLLYRLRVIQIVVPPLRERKDDIPLLVEYFLRKFRLPLVVEDEAMRALVRYRWPGNVRELQNVVEQISCLVTGSTIGLADLPDSLRTPGVPAAARERRRQVADQLFDGLVQKQYSFWDHIYPLFLRRDLTRHDLRELLSRGLTATKGNYRALLSLFGMPASDYHRFHNFLTTHDCKLDFRTFRTGSLVTASRRPALPKVS